MCMGAIPPPLPLYEVYITDPTQTSNEDEFITEIYYPVKKK